MYNASDASRTNDRNEAGAKSFGDKSDPNASRLVISELEAEIAQMSRKEEFRPFKDGFQSFNSPRKGNNFTDKDPSVNSLLGSLLGRDRGSKVPQLRASSHFFDSIPYGQVRQAVNVSSSNPRCTRS